MINNIELQKAIVSLFKSVLVDNIDENCKIDLELNKESLEYGILFNPNIQETLLNNRNLKKFIYELYGKDRFNLNNTFYKSYSEINTKSDEEIYFDRFLHYVTTYGFKSLGMYSSSTVYIPNDKLELPENINIVKVIYIKPMLKEEVEQRINNFLNSGIALNKETINYIVCIINNMNIDVDINSIKNKELKCILSIELNKLLNNSDDILRSLYYLATNDSTIIKSPRMTRSIKFTLSTSSIEKRFKIYNYFKLIEPMQKELSESFLRNKKLWLAFKNEPDSKPRYYSYFHTYDNYDFKNEQEYINSFINRLRKLATRNHRKMKILNNLSNIKFLFVAKFILNHLWVLDNETIFAKIKAFNYLNHKLSNDNELISYKNYRIRNGLTYSKEHQIKKLSDEEKQVYTLLMNEIYKNIKLEIYNIFKDKKVYIPENITYIAPTSEKKFINGIPEMSSIKFNDSFSVGIHWLNVIRNNKEEQTDLDLKLMSLYNTIGWDYSPKINDKVLFTGDITDASHKNNGATEAMLIDKSSKDAYLVLLNNYTNRFDIDYKLIFEDINDELIPDISKKYDIAYKQRNNPRDYNSNKKLSRLEANYIFDPSNCLTLNSVISSKEGSQKCLGLFYNKKFFFINTNIGSGSSAHRKEYLENFLKALIEENSTMLTINGLLHSFITNNKEEADIDLSLENITADTFINMFSNKNNEINENMINEN